jgi:hypothetical protein
MWEVSRVSDHYAVPKNPRFAIDTSRLIVRRPMQRILLKLEHARLRAEAEKKRRPLAAADAKSAS